MPPGQCNQGCQVLPWSLCHHKPQSHTATLSVLDMRVKGWVVSGFPFFFLILILLARANMLSARIASMGLHIVVNSNFHLITGSASLIHMMSMVAQPGCVLLSMTSPTLFACIGTVLQHTPSLPVPSNSKHARVFFFTSHAGSPLCAWDLRCLPVWQ